MATTEIVLSNEAPLNTPKPLVCWKSTFSGLFVAIVVFMGTLALSLAFGGIGLSDGSSAQAAGTFAAGSIILATILATFFGGYVTARLGRTPVDALGTTQGLVLASVFLVAVMIKVGSDVGALASVAGQSLGAAASVAGTAAQNPMVQDFVTDSLGSDLKFKSDASVVASGVASRLSRGDNEAAKNYLAAEAGLTPAEADARIAAAQVKINEAQVKIREATATAMKATGWSIFVVLVSGMVFGGLGGLAASKYNEAYTLDVPDELKAAYAKNKTRLAHA